jgi:hypothetical protein
MDERTQQLLERLGLTTRDTTGAMQQLLSALSRTASATNNQTNAATITAQSLQQMQSSAQSAASGFRSVLSIGTGVVSGFTSLTSSIYGADKAFTSVIPTLNFITNTFTKTVTAAGTVLSGFSIAGFSFGKASEAAAAGVTATFEILSNVIQFQIENAQKVSDQFVSLSKIGANFGGSIGAMGADAARLRIPLLEFGKIITTNVENLSKMGKSVRDAGFEVANYSAYMYENSDALVALYGNIENISVGVADFLASQAQLGMTDDKRRLDFNRQRDAMAEYLVRQKELTAITGQSADALKKAEEERRKDLAYQMKVSRMSPIAQENIKEGFAIAQAKFGDEAAQYLKEYVRTQGKVLDPAMIAYANGNQEVARTMQMFAENVNLSRDDFRRNYAGFIKENAGAYRGFAESIEDLAELPPSLMNNFVQTQTKMGASLIANQGFFEDLPATVERMIREGTQLRDVLTDPATKVFVDAERGRAAIQQKIDEVTLENMKNLGSTIEFLNKMTLAMVQGQESISKLLEKLKEAPTTAKEFNEYIGKVIVDGIFKRMGIPLSNSEPAGQPPPARIPEGGAAELPPSASLPGPAFAQSSPTVPGSPLNKLMADQALVMALLADSTAQKANQESSADQRRALESDITRLQTQIASLTSANSNNEKVVAVLTDQNDLMRGLNDKMDRMVDSNGRIFEALA